MVSELYIWKAMRDNRVIRLVKGMKPSEIQGFTHYAACPLFNQNAKVLHLVTVLTGAITNKEDILLENEALKNAMTPLEPSMTDQQLYDLFSQVNKLLGSYLAWLDYSRDEQAQSRHLLSALSEHEHPEEFRRSWKKISAKINPKGDLRSRQAAYQLSEIAAGEGRKSHGRGANPEAETDFSNMVDRLDRFYLFAKLKYTCETLNRQRVVNTQLGLQLVEEIQQFLSKGGLHQLNDAGIGLYYQVLLTLLEPDHTPHYDTLMLQLSETSHQLPREEQQAIYTFAQNYCIRKINSGQQAFLEALFHIYQNLLDSGLLIENEQLAHWHYKNIATVGLRLKRFDWVKAFLEKYRSSIPKNDQENAYTYNLSAYYYEVGQMKEALRLLQQVEFTDIFYPLSAKSLLLKIYFEQEDADGLSYHTQAFQAFLKRNKHVPEAHYHIYFNLIRYSKKANRLRLRQLSLSTEAFIQQCRELHEEVSNTTEIANKSWLLEQIDLIQKTT